MGNERTLTKFLQHRLKTGSIGNNNDGAVVEVANRCQGYLVISVDEAEIFDIQNGTDVASIGFVDGDAGETVCKYLIHRVEVENAGVGEHERVRDGRHDVSDRLSRHSQSTGDYVHLVRMYQTSVLLQKMHT